MKFIIDTDPGHDDVMAILLAVKAGMDVALITTVAGNSNIENTTRNARYVISLLQSNIPIHSGAAQPLSRELIQANVHGASGLDGIDPTNDAQLTGDAVQQILAHVRTNEETTIIALGPLTNIAEAIREDSEIMKKVKEIVIMGGAIRVPGNKNRVAEFNIFVDPEAADIVFRFPVVKTLVPLDACNHVQLGIEDFQQITNSALREPLLKMIKPYIKNIAKDEGVEAALMYDPLTVYYVLNPSACTVARLDVLVEINGGLTRGMTVADLRKNPEGSNFMNVVEHISAEAFTADFIRHLSKN